MSFSTEVSFFAEKDIEELESIRKAIIIELFSSVVLDTPVDTGRARGNWIYTLAIPDLNNADKSVDPSGSHAIDRINRLASGEDSTNHLTNNVPYILNLENGSSVQAPHGMVKKNLLRVDGWIRRHG